MGRTSSERGQLRQRGSPSASSERFTSYGRGKSEGTFFYPRLMGNKNSHGMPQSAFPVHLLAPANYRLVIAFFVILFFLCVHFLWENAPRREIMYELLLELSYSDVLGEMLSHVCLQVLKTGAKGPQSALTCENGFILVCWSFRYTTKYLMLAAAEHITPKAHESKSTTMSSSNVQNVLK